MNENNIKVAIAVTTSAVAVALAARSCIKTYREENQKQADIEKNMNLDIAAIRNAYEVLDARIDRGEIRNFSDLVNGFNTEIEFQKIAIREDI